MWLFYMYITKTHFVVVVGVERAARQPAMASAPANEATKLLLARLLELPSSVHFRVLPDPVLHVRSQVLRALLTPPLSTPVPAARPRSLPRNCTRRGPSPPLARLRVFLAPPCNP